MKKLTLILATLMVVAIGCLWAQNHRHTDRDNTAAIESIASNAADTTAVYDIDTEYENASADWTPSNDRNDDEDLAKSAIKIVFGTLGILFASPVIIVAIVLFFVYKNKQMKNKLAMAAIEKGVPVPGENSNNPEQLEKMIASQKNHKENQAIINAMNRKNRLENGIKKIAIGTGLCIGGWFIHFNILIAVGIAIAVYGIGLICLHIFVDKNDNTSANYNKAERHDEKPE